ncbi:TolC family protein [uncultured Desulfosarcina sp.]|uniref:TolC family protein n=1 Tax=uncultured Desulfosarcina sp. TaxID=218289 RepID=UPI0029C849A2|nr:TolC family protein [uncultured Desulfosarcina sp.]
MAKKTDDELSIISPPPSPFPTGSLPLKLTTADAVLLTLKNNRSLMVEQLNPAIQNTFEDAERAIFDPFATIEISSGRTDGKSQSSSSTGIREFSEVGALGVISLKQYFPTGATVTLEGKTEMNDSSLYRDALYWSRLGLTVNQALLSGAGTAVNLVRLRQARLDTRMSEYELRGFTQSLVAQTEETYWDYALAKRRVEIYEESLKVAQDQLNEALALIEVGRLAKSELPASQAELASQEQGLIDARSKRKIARLNLIRLLNPSGVNAWEREVDLIYQPALPNIKLDPVPAHVEVAKRSRPLLNETRVQLMRNDLEVVKTKNGLLPLLDLFVTLGKSGYADSFGRSFQNLTEDEYDAYVGIQFQYPIFNRGPQSNYRRSMLNREQAQKALDNLLQLVELDVRIAYVEVNRTREQIGASATTRRFSEETLRIETEKLRVGQSTSLLVAQAQRDLLISRIAEVEALASYIKALIHLYRQDGSLLERRGIVAPGRETVNLSRARP